MSWLKLIPFLFDSINLLFRSDVTRARVKRSILHFIEARVCSVKCSAEATEALKKVRYRRHQRDVKAKSYVFSGRAKNLPLLAPSGFLAIVVGHTKASSGALALPPLNEKEWEYSNRLSNSIVREAEKRGHRCEVYLSDTLGIEQIYQNISIRKADAIVELHFGESQFGCLRGSQTAYHDGEFNGARDKALAILTHRKICQALERDVFDDRGIKTLVHQSSPGCFNNLHRIKWLPTILVSPFFGSNSQDAKLGRDKKDEIARAVVAGFEEWLA